MKSIIKLIKRMLIIIIPLILVGLLILWLKSNKTSTEEKIYYYNKEKPVLVTVDTVKASSIANNLAYTGIFEPNRETKLSADQQGKIIAVFVDVGSYVKQGQTVIQLDNTLIKLQLKALEVQIEGFEEDVKRYAILVEADAIQGVQLEKATLGLKAAQAQKNSLLAQIEKTSIKAPFTGIVTAKFIEVGGFAAPGIPLLQITDLATLRFSINVPERELKMFTDKNNYNITPDTYPNENLIGKISLIGSKSNVGNSFPVQFLVNNTSSLSIKSGMFGKVFLVQTNEAKGMLIPSSAIIGSNDLMQVYLVRNGKALLKTISVSERIGNHAIVSNGLKAGDVIITKGLINLFEGANVITK